MNKRLDYIDVMRGIAILLVILEHCIAQLSNELARLVLSFHMPLFFFISGMCINPNMGGVKNYIYKKAKSILVPQLTLTATQIATAFILEVLLAHVHTWRQINYLDYLITWFLPVLFIAYVFFIPILMAKNIKYPKLTLVFLGIAFYAIPNINVIYVNQVTAALVFMFLGYTLRPFLDKFLIEDSKFKGYGWLGLILCCIVSTYNQPVAMYLSEYGNKTLFLLTSLLGIYSVWDISVSIKETEFLRWCGKVSIILYVFQFSIIRISMTLLNRILPSFSYNEYPFYLYTFLLVLIILIPITLYSDRYLGWAFGKSKTKIKN